MPRTRRPLPLLLLAAVAGCYAPSPEGGALLCSSDGKCPSGYSCLAGACWKKGTTPPAALNDSCEGAVPVRLTSQTSFAIDTTALKDNFSQVSCTGSTALGNDGFFAIDMAAGERWHFHAKVPVGSDWNPAIYILSSCDDRACSGGIDECDAGQDEHFSFIAPKTNRYLIGVDGRSAGGVATQLFAIRPNCGGGGPLEHSEPCEPGADCDSQCRYLLGSGGDEKEPNDDYPGANVMKQEAAVGKTSARGTLGGRCDYDMYLLTVRDKGSVVASVTAPGGVACAMGSTPLRLALYDRGGLIPLGTVDGAPCPALTSQPFAANLPGGTYYLRVSPLKQDAAELKYELQVETK